MRQFITIAVTLLLCARGLSAQTPTNRPTLTNDSIAKAARLKSLDTQRRDLTKRIKAEDAKRNKHIDGVSPETMEAMNDLQDSLCVALRSQLAEITLEIRELSPSPRLTTATIQEYINTNRPDTINKTKH